MLCTSLVPLQLVNENNNEVFWINTQSSSVRFCRPVKIEYSKETIDVCKAEEVYLNEQINRLQNFTWKGHRISFKLHLTMIDNKSRYFNYKFFLFY